LAEERQGVLDAEVSREKRVRVGQCAHRDVFRCPAPDAGEREELGSCLVAAASGVDSDLAGGDGARERLKGFAASVRSGEVCWVGVRDRLG
jgi:hypothetical protein